MTFIMIARGYRHLVVGGKRPLEKQKPLLEQWFPE
jgi:hypothetical protein